MPKLRRLNGHEVLRILQEFGFEVVSIRGSHHHLRRVVDNQRQNLNVPLHGSKPLRLGTLKSIYRQARAYVPEEDLKQQFYSE